MNITTPEPITKTERAKEMLAKFAKAHGFTVDELNARDRSSEMVFVRQLACYLLHEVAGLTSPHVGRMMQREHGTVLAACIRIKEIQSVYPRQAEGIELWTSWARKQMEEK